jgi:hypothetical protein
MFIQATIAASMLSSLGLAAYAKAPDMTYPPAWGQQTERTVRTSAANANLVPQQKSRFHRHHPRLSGGTGAPPPSQILKLQSDILALRKELEAVRAEVGRPTPERVVLGPSFLQFGVWGTVKPAEKVAGALNLPSLASLAPTPEPLSLPVLTRLEAEAYDRVRLATLYLIKTATVGLTMSLQTPEVAIGRLHPDFRVKLAEAIRLAREKGLEHAGIFSAYRPPAFGVGGFSDKYNSLHSYGLAADIAGIGTVGSSASHIWKRVVDAVGLYLPYGPSNQTEYNHTQLIPNKVAAIRLRGTITANQPKDLHAMWLASGIKDHVMDDVHPISTADRLPENAYP